MNSPSRREVLGTLGTMAAAGGWIALDAQAARAQPAAAPSAAGPAEYALPPLPYAYDALEPHIDKETMMLHHDKHHKAYVDGLNAALAGLDALRKAGGAPDADKVRALSDSVSFNGSGHALHCIFWKNMKKDGGGDPKGALAEHLARDFGSVDACKAQFSATAAKVQGSGWGILAWEPLGSRLIVLGAEKHQNSTLYGCAPLLVLDVWEHAYYLKYRNMRADYIKAWWNVVNWDDVAERVAAAMKR